jgi:hypothetical protein
LRENNVIFSIFVDYQLVASAEIAGLLRDFTTSRSFLRLCLRILNHPDSIRQSPHSIVTSGRASARHLKTGGEFSSSTFFPAQSRFCGIAGK